MPLKREGPRDLFRYAAQKHVLPLKRSKAFVLTPRGHGLTELSAAKERIWLLVLVHPLAREPLAASRCNSRLVCEQRLREYDERGKCGEEKYPVLTSRRRGKVKKWLV